MKPNLWEVVYLVKYSELWCADECSWIQHVEDIEAADELEARRIARRKIDDAPRIIRGRHVVTRRVSR
jgi:hypothetical protein